MRDYAFDYTIWKDNSPQQFKQACALIERQFPGMTKKPLLIDVDGSTIQSYTKDGEEVVIVYDDYDIGAVFALSDFDLSTVMEQMSADR